MANKTIARISLDIYNNNYIMVNAKQADIYSRFVEITVTEKGKPLILDKEMMTVHVRCNKPDGTYVYSQGAKITDDGKVMVKLEQQMLTVYGQCYLDLTLLQYSETDESTESTPRYTVSVLSTMGFYLNVVSQPIDPTVVISTNDFNVLTRGINDMLILQKEVEASIKTVENIDKAETQRVSAEQGRVEAENLRQTNIANAIATCEKATSDANSATSKANTATTKANTATSNANAATERANTAAEVCENVIDGSGIILNEEKGVANGIATLDSNGEIPLSQINTSFTVGNKSVINSGEDLDKILGKIVAYMNAFDSMPVVHTGTSDPSNSLGNNGDYYLKLLSE